MAPVLLPPVSASQICHIPKEQRHSWKTERVMEGTETPGRCPQASRAACWDWDEDEDEALVLSWQCCCSSGTFLVLPTLPLTEMWHFHQAMLGPFLGLVQLGLRGAPGRRNEGSFTPLIPGTWLPLKPQPFFLCYLINHLQIFCLLGLQSRHFRGAASQNHVESWCLHPPGGAHSHRLWEIFLIL